MPFYLNNESIESDSFQFFSFLSLLFGGCVIAKYIRRFLEWCTEPTHSKSNLPCWYPKQASLKKHIALSLFCININGCSSLYLHSDADQKAMERAQKALTNSKEEHLKVVKKFDDLIAAQHGAV
ncbi:MAG: hypothetical protein ACXWFX_15460, partial [Methylobacter sp.]